MTVSGMLTIACWGGIFGLVLCGLALDLYARFEQRKFDRAEEERLWQADQARLCAQHNLKSAATRAERANVRPATYHGFICSLSAVQLEKWINAPAASEPAIRREQGR